MRILCLLLTFLTVYGQSDEGYDQSSIYYTEPTFINVSNSNANGGLSELHGGRIVRGQRLLERSKSPYLVREDLFVEREGELVIEPGVEIRFGPMIGITVRGIITAKVILKKKRYNTKFIPATFIRPFSSQLYFSSVNKYFRTYFGQNMKKFPIGTHDYSFRSYRNAIPVEIRIKYFRKCKAV